MPARPRLTVIDFERLGDAADLRALLARGISPDARLGADRHGVERPPLWIAACQAGPEALQVLLDEGCSFEPAPLARSPHQNYLLPYAVASGSSRALWALRAAKSGTLPLCALGQPMDLWHAFHTLCAHAQASHESSSFLSEPLTADTERAAGRSELSVLHALIQERSGPCDNYGLRPLVPQRLYWVLTLHLAAFERVSTRLAQDICDSRLPTGGPGSFIAEARGAWTWLLADAARAGHFLSNAAPHMDLALDAARARPWEVAFACTAGARAELASEEPLAVLARSVLDPLAGPHLGSLSGALPAALAASLLRPTILELALGTCVEYLTASGSRFSRADRFGRSARARASDYENELQRARQSQPSSGAAFAGSASTRGPFAPPGGHLTSLILALADREELDDLTGLAPRTRPLTL